MNFWQIKGLIESHKNIFEAIYRKNNPLYHTSIDKIAARTGLDFLYLLSDNKEKAIELITSRIFRTFIEASKAFNRESPPPPTAAIH